MDNIKKKVLFLSSTFCTRALKEYYQLSDSGFQVFVGYSKPSTHLNYINQKALYKYSQEGVSHIISRVHPDIIHVHNTPNRHAIWSRKSFRGPIVFDIHDATLSQGPAATEQIKAIESCDFVYTVNDDYASNLKNVFGISKTIYGIPSIYWITNFVKEPKISDSDGQSHIVFIGSMATKDVAEQWCSQFKSVAERERIHIHAHVNYFKDTVEKFASNYFHHEPEILFKDIPRVLSRYDAGIVPSRGGPLSLPNKFFDYINAGIPVISEPGRGLLCQYIQKYQIGLSKKLVDISDRDIRQIACLYVDRFAKEYRFPLVPNTPPYAAFK